MLLLDEPLSALDAKVRLQLRDEIRRIQISLGITTVLVTHDQEEALSIADRVAVMRAGRLEQCAPPAELYARPATAFVAEFVGTMNRMPGVMGPDDLVHVGEQRLPVDGEHPPANTPVWVLARPEAVHASPTADAGSEATAGSASGSASRSSRFASSSASSSALVQVATFLGAVTRVTMTLPDGTDVKADLPSHEAGAVPDRLVRTRAPGRAPGAGRAARLTGAGHATRHIRREAYVPGDMNMAPLP